VVDLAQDSDEDDESKNRDDDFDFDDDTPAREVIKHNDNRGSLGHAPNEVMAHHHPDEGVSALTGSEELEGRGDSVTGVTWGAITQSWWARLMGPSPSGWVGWAVSGDSMVLVQFCGWKGGISRFFLFGNFDARDHHNAPRGEECWGCSEAFAGGRVGQGQPTVHWGAGLPAGGTTVPSTTSRCGAPGLVCQLVAFGRQYAPQPRGSDCFYIFCPWVGVCSPVFFFVESDSHGWLVGVAGTLLLPWQGHKAPLPPKQRVGSAVGPITVGFVVALCLVFVNSFSHLRQTE